MRSGAYKVAAIIVAAGSGRRIGAAVPKQLLPLGGKPILQRTLERFQSHPMIDDIIVVLPLQWVDELKRVMIEEWDIDKITAVAAGGAERYESVSAGLDAVDAEADVVMIHDGVRPFVGERLIRESIEAAIKTGAAVVGLPPKDTIKRVAQPNRLETLDRSQLVQIQTPQTFRSDVIRRAYRTAAEKKAFSTDDAALVEQMGGEVAVVPGEWINIKITSPEDLIFAEALLNDETADRTRF